MSRRVRSSGRRPFESRPAKPVSAGTGASRALRVLRVADVPAHHLGGVSRATRATSAQLVERGHRIDHLFTEDMPVPGARAWRRILVPLFVVRHVRRLRRGGEAPDVVEIHEPLGAPYALLRALTGRRGLPAMVAFSHGLEERGWQAQRARWRRRQQRASLKSRLLVPLTLVAQAKTALRLADVVIVLSSQDRDYLAGKRFMRAARVHRIDNGVDDELLRSSGPPRAAHPLVSILFIGQWIDRKGTPEIVEAFERLCRDHPAVRLLVAGSGTDRATVLADFPTAVRDRITVKESVTRLDLEESLRHADVFVLPSWFEGMPLSLLEAAAAGLPVVASDTCGIRDILRPADPQRDGGALVSPQDADALHAALDRLVRDPELRSTLGTRAQARAQTFTWEASAAALERAYRAATTGRRPER